MTITGDNGDNLLEGGWGAQTILGLDGDDVIYGDPTEAPTAPFVLVDAVRDPGPFDGAWRAVSAEIGGATYVYGTSIEEGGLAAWRLTEENALEEVFVWETFGYAGPIEIGGRALLAVEFGGVDYLFTAGFGLSVSAIGADGTLTHIDTVYDDLTLNIDRPAAVAAFEVGGDPYVVAAGWNGQGISVFRIDPELGFVHVESHDDAADSTLRGVTDLEVAAVGGALFVIASGYHDSGVTVFSVGPGGALTRADHDSTELDLFDFRLDGTVALAIRQTEDAAHLYVASEFGDLSVYEITAEGVLVLLEIWPGAYDDLQVAALAGAQQLFASAGGQAIAVFDISEAGLLTPAEGFDAGGVGEAGALGVVATPSGVFLTVAQGEDDGFDLLQAAVAGDDVIEGGDGKDEIHGGGGADHIDGGAGADNVWGDDGDDVIFGRDGADTLRGGGGNDYLHGGAKADTMRGGTGEDEMIGGAGADWISGGAGGDRLTGNNGLDELWGGIGWDVLKGGPGADLLIGNNGLDELWGGSGQDELRGGPGADTLNGQGGDDRLTGGSGQDVLTGGAGDDVFVFAKNSGKDVVTDFDRAADLIEIGGLAGGYAALTITAAGADAIVSFGNVEITFENTPVADLDPGAFLFV